MEDNFRRGAILQQLSDWECHAVTMMRQQSTTILEARGCTFDNGRELEPGHGLSMPSNVQILLDSMSQALPQENVKTWIPDMPDEYFRPLGCHLSHAAATNLLVTASWRMPSPAPKSDLIRYALLYHHGGLYMDADFVAVKVPHLEWQDPMLRGHGTSWLVMPLVTSSAWLCQPSTLAAMGLC
eukprot:Skav232673  [mRNA]  locus=scaffold698:292895:293987:+ [translate_table: standard]